MSQRSVRSFSTISGVHPAYLPSLHKASRVEKKLVPAAVATVGIGYGLVKYKQTQRESQHGQLKQSAARRQTERQQAEDAMMATYGDRSSLADLEAALEAYEKQRNQR